jgi:hypothetical protein
MGLLPAPSLYSLENDFFVVLSNNKKEKKISFQDLKNRKTSLTIRVSTHWDKCQQVISQPQAKQKGAKLLT